MARPIVMWEEEIDDDWAIEEDFNDNGELIINKAYDTAQENLRFVRSLTEMNFDKMERNMQVYVDALDKARVWRHDFLGYEVSTNLGIRFVGDSNVSDFCKMTISNYPSPDYFLGDPPTHDEWMELKEERLAAFKLTKTFNKDEHLSRLTPDQLFYFRKNELVIVDYSVRKNAEGARKEKFSKYQGFVNDLSGVFKKIYIININYTYKNPLSVAAFTEIVDIEFGITDTAKNILDSYLEFEDWVFSTIPAEYKDELALLDRKGDPLFLDVCSFSMSTSETRLFIDSLPRKTLQAIMKREGSSFFSDLNGIIEKDSYEFLSDEKETKKKKDLVELSDSGMFGVEYEDFGLCGSPNITEDYMDYRDWKPARDSHICSLPQKPEGRKIEEALLHMEENAANSFEEIQSSKLVCPFPFTNKRYKFSSGDGDTRFQTLIFLSEKLSRLETGKNTILGNVKNLLFFSKFDMNEIAEFFQGERQYSLMTETQELIPRDLVLFDKEIPIKTQGAISRLIESPDESVAYERGLSGEASDDRTMFNSGAGHNVKAGRNGLSVRISKNSSVFQCLFNKMRVGVKKAPNRKEHNKPEDKKKSMPFWDPDFSESHHKQFDKSLNRFAFELILRGSDLKPEFDEYKRKNPLGSNPDEDLDKLRLGVKDCVFKWLYHMERELELNMSFVKTSHISDEEYAEHLPKDLMNIPTDMKERIIHIIDDFQRSENSVKRYQSLECIILLMLGIISYYNEIQVTADNLSYNGAKACDYFRYAFSNNASAVYIIPPTSSLLNQNTELPVLTVIYSKEPKLCHLDNKYPYMSHELPDGEGYIHITKGCRFQRPRLEHYRDCLSKFLGMIGIYFSLRTRKSESEDDLSTVSVQTIMRVFSLVLNVNISTSSLLDNARYMIENILANYSFGTTYIQDKMMVNLKNSVQLELYHWLKSTFLRLHDGMTNARSVNAEIDSGTEEVNLRKANLINTKFFSIISERTMFENPMSIIQECYALFFICPKALHGKMHTEVKIHRTPVDIQLDLDKKLDDDDINNMSKTKLIKTFFGQPNSNKFLGKCRSMTCGERHEYNPYLMVQASEKVNNTLQTSFQSIRKSYIMGEGINKHPLNSKTMCSTKSVLTEAEFSGKFKIGKEGSNYYYKNHLLFTETELDNLHKKLGRMGSRGKNGAGEKAVKEFKKECRERCTLSVSQKRLSLDEKMALLTDIDIIMKGIKFDNSTGTAVINLKTALQEKKQTFIDRGGSDNLTFFTSGVVLTENINHINKGDKYKLEGGDAPLEFFPMKGESQIGKECKRFLLDGAPFKFAVRPKGQRTQEDREIYVCNLPMKYMVYAFEHLGKSIGRNLHVEKISVPGDEKIIDLTQQTRNFFKAINKFHKEKKEGELIHHFHFNLDMTKWAPKDMLLKFTYFVAKLKFLTKGEKRFFICFLLKMMTKELTFGLDLLNRFQDEIYNSNIESEIKSLHEVLLKDGEWQNSFNVQDSWLMGMFNYPSSVVHGAFMLLIKESLEEIFGIESVYFLSNVHSDDNQTDIIIKTKLSEQATIDIIWKNLDFFLRCGCMEISLKKSYISQHIKLFVSQYNIGGQQHIPWVKLVMSMISGLPYTGVTDDVCSVLSKACSAISQGADKVSVNYLTGVILSRVFELYGIIKHGKNVISEVLGIEPKWLPLCLGGIEDVDWLHLMTTGPTAVDALKVYNLGFRFCKATPNTEPKNLPESAEHIKALQSFVIVDSLSTEGEMDDVEQSSKGVLNPFKQIHFLSKRSKFLDPFYTPLKRARMLRNEDFKKERPSLLIKRPKKYDDLMSFYDCLYTDKSFKASMSGSNQEMLRITKTYNRNKGNFRLASSACFKGQTDEDILPKFYGKNSLNAENVGKLLLSLMASRPLDIVQVQLVWRKTFKTNIPLQLSVAIDYSSRSIVNNIKHNKFPNKKPENKEYSTLHNDASTILMYLFDEINFKRDELELSYPASLWDDYLTICERFPFVDCYLKILSENQFDHYSHFLELKAGLRGNRSRENRILESNSFESYILAMQYEIANELKALGSEDQLNLSQHKLDIIISGIKKDLSNLSSRLSRMTERNLNRQKLITNISQKEECLNLLESSHMTELSNDQIKKAIEFVDIENVIENKAVTPQMELEDYKNVKTDPSFIKQSLPDILAFITRNFSKGTSRIYMLEKESVSTPKEFILAMKGVLTSNLRIHKEWVSGINLDKKNTPKTSDLRSKAYAAAIGFYNLYYVLLFFSGSELDGQMIRGVLMGASFDGFTIRDLMFNFYLLSNALKKRCIFPIAFCYCYLRDTAIDQDVKNSYKSSLSEVVKHLDSLRIDWIVEEDPQTGNVFQAEIHGDGLIMKIYGASKTISKINIEYYDSNSIDARINFILDRFIKILRYRKGQIKSQKLNMSDSLKLQSDKTDLSYNVSTGTFSSKISKYNTSEIKWVSGAKLVQVNKSDIVKTTLCKTKIDIENNGTTVKYIKYDRSEGRHERKITLSSLFLNADMSKLRLTTDQQTKRLEYSIEEVFKNENLWLKLAKREFTDITVEELCSVSVKPGWFTKAAQNTPIFLNLYHSMAVFNENILLGEVWDQTTLESDAYNGLVKLQEKMPKRDVAVESVHAIKLELIKNEKLKWEGSNVIDITEGIQINRSSKEVVLVQDGFKKMAQVAELTSYSEAIIQFRKMFCLAILAFSCIAKDKEKTVNYFTKRKLQLTRDIESTMYRSCWQDYLDTVYKARTDLKSLNTFFIELHKECSLLFDSNRAYFGSEGILMELMNCMASDLKPKHNAFTRIFSGYRPLQSSPSSLHLDRVIRKAERMGNKKPPKERGFNIPAGQELIGVWMTSKSLETSTCSSMASLADENLDFLPIDRIGESVQEPSTEDLAQELMEVDSEGACCMEMVDDEQERLAEVQRRKIFDWAADAERQDKQDTWDEILDRGNESEIIEHINSVTGGLELQVLEDYMKTAHAREQSFNVRMELSRMHVRLNEGPVLDLEPEFQNSLITKIYNNWVNSPKENDRLKDEVHLVSKEAFRDAVKAEKTGSWFDIVAFGKDNRQIKILESNRSNFNDYLIFFMKELKMRRGNKQAEERIASNLEEHVITSNGKRTDTGRTVFSRKRQRIRFNPQANLRIFNNNNSKLLESKVETDFRTRENRKKLKAVRLRQSDEVYKSYQEVPNEELEILNLEDVYKLAATVVEENREVVGFVPMERSVEQENDDIDDGGSWSD